VTKILFTMQMGSQADKDGLAAEVLDVSTIKKHYELNKKEQ
jgi:hypothetical protein